MAGNEVTEMVSSEAFDVASPSTASYGFIRSVGTTSFTFGGSLMTLQANSQYDWVAISGIV